MRSTVGLALILGSLAISGVGWYRLHHIDRLHYQSTAMETIRDRAYLNEKIELDGKSFEHCQFQHVTLIYHGLAPTEFKRDCQFTFTAGDAFSVGITTDNDGIMQFLLAARAIQGVRLPDGQTLSVSLFGHDDHGNLIPLDK